MYPTLVCRHMSVEGSEQASTVRMTNLLAVIQGREISKHLVEVRGTVCSARSPIGAYAMRLREVTNQLGHW
jgi:hypothetical protein